MLHTVQRISETMDKLLTPEQDLQTERELLDLDCNKQQTDGRTWADTDSCWFSSNLVSEHAYPEGNGVDDVP